MSEINIIDNIDAIPRMNSDSEDLDWILTKPAYNMNYDIYEYVLYALATFIMAQKVHQHVDNMFTCIMMSVSKAKALGVYDNAEETDPLWEYVPGYQGGLILDLTMGQTILVVLDGYDGAGGVPLGSFWRRFIFGWEFEDVNFVFSSAMRDDSRVLYRRSVRNRVSTVAPWLELDDDPYMVVSDGGLYWIQDAFVTTDRFPYSRTIQVVQSSGDSFRSRTVFDRPLNYIRNSVKVVVDAYNGSMIFYTLELDKPDPVLGMWRNAFPSLFTPIDQMPTGLRKSARTSRQRRVIPSLLSTG